MRWNDDVEQYLYLDHADQKKVTATYRRATMWYGVALDHMMRESSRLELRNFVLTDEKLEELRQNKETTRPNFLVRCIDQAGDGLCLHWWMCHVGNIPEIILYDPQHAIPNDLWLALNDVGLHLHMYGSCVTLNMVFSPFNGCKRWRQIQAGFSRWLQISKHAEDGLFKWLLPRLLNDHNELHKRFEPNIENTVFSRIKESSGWKCRGYKVSMSRWSQWGDAEAERDPHLHERVLAQLVVCMELGLILGIDQAPEKSAKKLKLAVQKQDGAKKSTSDKSSFVTSLMKDSSNLLHAATKVMMAPGFQENNRLVLDFQKPFRVQHGQTNRFTRSRENNAIFWRETASGRDFEALRTLLVLFRDPETLERAGLTTSLHPLCSIKGYPISDARTSAYPTSEHPTSERLQYPMPEFLQSDI